MTKSINFSIDEALLERLDNSAEVRLHGRSAVARQALADYLDRKVAEEQRKETEEEINRACARAYGPGTPPDELEDWATEAVWPD